MLENNILIEINQFQDWPISMQMERQQKFGNFILGIRQTAQQITKHFLSIR